MGKKTPGLMRPGVLKINFRPYQNRLRRAAGAERGVLRGSGVDRDRAIDAPDMRLLRGREIRARAGRKEH